MSFFHSFCVIFYSMERIVKVGGNTGGGGGEGEINWFFHNSQEIIPPFTRTYIAYDIWNITPKVQLCNVLDVFIICLLLVRRASSRKPSFLFCTWTRALLYSTATSSDSLSQETSSYSESWSPLESLDEISLLLFLKGWFSLAHQHKHNSTYAEAVRCW